VLDVLEMKLTVRDIYYCFDDDDDGEVSHVGCERRMQKRKKKTIRRQRIRGCACLLQILMWIFFKFFFLFYVVMCENVHGKFLLLFLFLSNFFENYSATHGELG
jgi:hypothetical protein